MIKLFKWKHFIDLIMAVCLISAFGGLIFYSKDTAQAARDGFTLCVDIILPSLFPFFVISSLIIELGLTRYMGALLEPVMRPVFRLNGACAAAVVLGFLGGYPVGAKSAISLYEKKLCSKTEAERLLAFCNNSGPAFILGAVGAGILGSSEAGWILYLTHTAASLIVGILFRFYKRKSRPDVSSGTDGIRKPARLSAAFTNSVKSSFSSVFYISAFVIFFTVAVKLLFISGFLPSAADAIGQLFGFKSRSVEQLLTGLIEITSGLWSLQGGASSKLAGSMAMAAFMLGWAGLSVHMQVLSFIGESGLSAKTYIAGKLLHGAFSAILTAIVVRAMGYAVPVSSFLAEQVELLAKLRFWDTFIITLQVVLCLLLIFFLGAAAVLCRSRN